jgi:hypothetical protein
MPANLLQAMAITRYHRHLQRLGRAGTLDDTARLWVGRFAHLWRVRFTEYSRAA